MLARVILTLNLIVLCAWAQSAPQARLTDEDLAESATPAALAAQPSARGAEAPAEPSLDFGGPAIYSSPSGLFQLEVPVLAELGGRINDDKMFVHFSDAYTTHISVAAVEMDATFRWELSTLGVKDFLTKAFSSMIMPQFKANCPETQPDSVQLMPKFMDGALYVGTVHPGFSNFLFRTSIAGRQVKLHTGRRGTLVFIKGEYLFIISSELGERATEGSLHVLTEKQENDLLKARVMGIARKMTITLPAAPAAQK